METRSQDLFWDFMWVQGSKVSFPRCISREMNQKRSSWDSSQWLYRMLALQVPAVPHYQPCARFYFFNFLILSVAGVVIASATETLGCVTVLPSMSGSPVAI